MSDGRPSPPGDYDVVVVGSGPGGLQTAYFLGRLGVRYALLSRDDAPAGMFRRYPIFERLITWTKPEAPVERSSREYEWYDHNSLLAEEPELRALVPDRMDRTYDLPSRAEMEAGLVEFAERAGLGARFGCTWESTRVEEGRVALTTSDGEYRARAVVFALGVTEPWTAPVPGLEHAAHYVDTKPAEAYRGRRVFIVGKRNSGFEVAQTLLPWARELVLASPRPVKTDTIALSALRMRYLHPYDEYARGAPGTYVIDASIESVERTADGFRVRTRGTSWDGDLVFDADDVIAATGFRTPLRDLPALGLATVDDGRVPALTPFWESVSLPGVYFAGNASHGARGAGRRGAGASSTSVNGFRYNARVLARHLAATRFGVAPSRRRLAPEQVVGVTLAELTSSPDLRVQKGYLCHVLLQDGAGFVDQGIEPLVHFLDAGGPPGVAASLEIDQGGTIAPVVYVRDARGVVEHPLPPHPLHDFRGEPYRRELTARLRGLLRG